MNTHMLSRSRLYPGDRVLTGRLILPDNPELFRSGASAEPPRTRLEVWCDRCNQTCRYLFLDWSMLRGTFDMVLPIPAPDCRCPEGYYIGLDRNKHEHIKKLDDFSVLRREWDHARSLLSPEIMAIQDHNNRLRLDMMNFKY
jgi:hypothetical protein